MTDAVIVSTARTPIGKAYRGALNATEGATIGLADRRAGGGDDNCIGHGRPPVANSCCLGGADC